MPNYTYCCPTCGPFTVRQSIHDNHDVYCCPSCNTYAQRQFQAFQTYRLDANLKKRIELGQQPKIVKKEAIAKKATQQATQGRPWMAGH